MILKRNCTLQYRFLIISSSNKRKDNADIAASLEGNYRSPRAWRAYLAFQRKGLKVCTKREREKQV